MSDFLQWIWANRHDKDIETALLIAAAVGVWLVHELGVRQLVCWVSELEGEEWRCAR